MSWSWNFKKKKNSWNERESAHFLKDLTYILHGLWFAQKTWMPYFSKMYDFAHKTNFRRVPPPLRTNLSPCSGCTNSANTNKHRRVATTHLACVFGRNNRKIKNSNIKALGSPQTLHPAVQPGCSTVPAHRAGRTNENAILKEKHDMYVKPHAIEYVKLCPTQCQSIRQTEWYTKSHNHSKKNARTYTTKQMPASHVGMHVTP